MKQLRRLAVIVLLYVVVLGIGGYYHSHPSNDSLANCNICHVLHAPSLHHFESQWSPSVAFFGLISIDSNQPVIAELAAITSARAPPLS
jgi:hypothetical protein